MIERDDILMRAVDECVTEMYAWAQPPVDYKKCLDGTLKPLDTKDDMFYKRHYLSHENICYIIDRFIYNYHIGNDWCSNMELLKNYITSSESVKDVYIKEDNKPGYRGYEKIKPLQDIVKNETEYKAILDLLDNAAHTYSRDSELSSFNWATMFGCEPISNKEVVEEYWREHGYPDFTCIDFNIEDILYPDDEEENEPLNLNRWNIEELNCNTESNDTDNN